MPPAKIPHERPGKKRADTRLSKSSVKKCFVALLFVFFLADNAWGDDLDNAFQLRFGIPLEFTNTNQFEDIQDRAGLSDFSIMADGFSLYGAVSIGLLKKQTHFYLINFLYSLSLLEVRDGDSYSQFEQDAVGIGLSYGYANLLSRHLRIMADLNFSFPTWRYNLASDDFSGVARNDYLAIQPGVGIEYMGKDLGLGIIGGYSFAFYNQNPYVAGDFDKDDFADVDMNYAFVKFHIFMESIR